jgi:hypothetical protein
MPVIGPNLEWAREKGRKIGEEMFAKMVADHRLLDPTVADYKLVKWPNTVQRWNAAKEKFLQAVEDIFEEDCGNGW